MNLKETVKTAIDGAVGVITLDRPRALNALDKSMCLAIDSALTSWATDESVAAVLIRSSTERAFCAGGDVRQIHDNGLAWKRGQGDGSLGREFFRDEYRMNHKIRSFPKPYIALIDGITMGGGVGLSVHGEYRIATERTLLAMPETGIGLFPDVGTSYVLPRLPGEFGTYLALTGARIKAADALALGLATHFVSANRLDELTTALIGTINVADAVGMIEKTMMQFATDPGTPELIDHRALIDQCFGHNRVEEILAELDRQHSMFAQTAAATIRAMSPTSVKLTLKEMRQGRSLDFSACLRMEYRLSQYLLAGHDFYEGVRAQLVDKDRDPKWYPASLDAVDDNTLDSYFLSPVDGDLTFPA